MPDTSNFREKVNDPFGCVRVPPFQARIKTVRVVVIRVFVQIVDSVAESGLEKEEKTHSGKQVEEVEYVEYTSFQDVCGSILVIPLKSGLRVNIRDVLTKVVGKSH